MLDMKENEFKTFLHDKNMTINEINKVLDHQYRYKDIDMLKNAKFIYEIFDFIGLSTEEINKLIITKVSILDYSKEEILKIAFVFKEANLIDYVFEYSSVIDKYKRIYMRYLILQKMFGDINVNPSLLFVSSDLAFGRNGLSKIILNNLNEKVDNDEELEEFLNETFKKYDNSLTIDKLIHLNSRKLFSDYISSRRKSDDGKGSK